MRPLSYVIASLVALAGLMMSTAPVEAAAPASLEGGLLRLWTAYTSLRSITYRSIAFHANGIAQDNWVKLASTMTVPVVVYRDGPPATWTYTYNKLSDSTAELTLTSTRSEYSKLTLHFTDDQSGTVDENPPRWSGFSGSFKLIEGAAQPNPLINISTRVRVHPGEPTIVGFICARPADFVLRVAGPALANFQVSDVWKTPKFQLFAGANKLSGSVPDPLPNWESRVGISEAFQRVGAFPFAQGSKDVAVLVDLEPGPYTIVVQPDADDPGGNALIEVYQLY